MQSTVPRMTAGMALAAALAALALPVAAQSPSAPASPTAATSPAPVAGLGAVPSGYTWTTLAAPTGAEEVYPRDSSVTADGTWTALAKVPSNDANVLVWHLGPTDTAVEQTEIAKSASTSSKSYIADPYILMRLGDQLLAVGSGKTWSSRDGSAWTPAKNKLKGLALGGSAGDGIRAVVLGTARGKGDMFVLSTSDGKAFTRATIAAPEEGRALLSGVALSPTGIVVVSGKDRDEQDQGYEMTRYLWSSPDGVTFTPATLPFEAKRGNYIRRLVAAPSGFVMVALLEEVGTVIYASPDGQTWTETFASRNVNPDSIVAVPASSGGGLLMIGNGVLYTSPDGVSWTETPTPELEGVGQASTVAALPDGRIVLTIYVFDPTTESSHAAVLVGTPQP